jgi:hypothetical protein
MNGFSDTTTVPQNDVWGTLTKTVADVFRAREERKQVETVARIQAQTQAAPAGTPNYWFQNPLPGLFSNFPQADTKAVTQTPSTFSMQGNPLLWLLLALLALLLLLRRGR